MAEHDLTSTIAFYLDRHLVFPLLEFLQENKLYDDEDIMRIKFSLLQKTNMVDFAMEVYKSLNNTETVPEEMKEHREVVVGNLKRLQSEAQPILRFLAELSEQNPMAVKELRTNNPYNYATVLEEQYKITQKHVDVLYNLARFQFECGNYSGAAEYLYYFRLLTTDLERSFMALWGKLASEILMLNWDTALEDLEVLRKLVDSRHSMHHGQQNQANAFVNAVTNPTQQLEERTWLIHWSLFVFFNHPNGKNGIVDLFFDDRYMNAIQTSCPHLLRYLAAAVITNKRRRTLLKDLVRIIEQERYRYKKQDPIIDFLVHLYVNVDFGAAQQCLEQCQQVLMNDCFLVSCAEEFIENARLFIFETYCSIHSRIDTRMLAARLGMDEASAERWIVNLIRNSRLDAKIDSQSNQIVMTSQHPSIYQQVIDKTKGCAFRSSVLAQSADRRMPKPEEATGEAAQ